MRIKFYIGSLYIGRDPAAKIIGGLGLSITIRLYGLKYYRFSSHIRKLKRNRKEAKLCQH